MASDQAGTPWTELLAGAAVLEQKALSRLEVPALILDLPSRRIRAANQPIADLFGVQLSTMIGRVNSDVVAFDDEGAMLRSIEAISSGALDGYLARRRIVAADGAEKIVIVWCRAIELEGQRYAVYIISPIGPEADGLSRLLAGPLVVGRAGADLRVSCISSDVRDVLGWEPADAVDRSLLTDVPADEVARLVDAVRRSPAGGATSAVLRLRHRDGQWLQMQCLFVRIGDATEPDAAFALMPDGQRPPAGDRVTEMEMRLRRIAAELRAAGVIDDIGRLPTAEEFPQINTLTSRQWQILVRLMRGERVPTIAAELYLSAGTVRNHLADIFERFGVHSQAELIRLLRSR